MQLSQVNKRVRRREGVWGERERKEKGEVSGVPCSGAHGIGFDP